jgi:hypothetical protein
MGRDRLLDRADCVHHAAVDRRSPALALDLLADPAGVLRVPAIILQLTGVWPTRTPRWYVVYQGIIGLVQLAIGLAMLADYKRFGVWGKRSH